MAAEQSAAGIKVFVGNLSFRVQRDELQKTFEAVGKVLSANIITRGRRSRGYGFVEMATIQDAENAVAELNHKEIDSRQINVEIAKPREEGSAPPPRRGGGRGRGRGFRGGRGRGFRGGRGRSGPPRGEDNENASSEVKHDYPRGRGRGYGRGRGRQPRRSPQNRQASDDTLFVANLPFSTTDEELSSVFDQYKPVKAHVVVGRGGRSKGFGFVTFPNSEAQQNALKTLNGAQCQSRSLSIKVAWNPEPQAEGEKAADSGAPSS